MSQKNPCTEPTTKRSPRLTYVLYAVALAFIAIAPLAYFLYNVDSDEAVENSRVTIEYAQPQPKSMAPGLTFGVLSCKVIDGHVFHVLLDNQQWHEVRLKTVAKEEATADVVEVLKRTHSPTVTLRRHVEGYWVVDFNIILDGRRISLVEWLAERMLLL